MNRVCPGNTKEEQKLLNEQITAVSEHLSGRKLSFQDREFEDFIIHLFELKYSGLRGTSNNQKQEAKDGKDLTMSLDFDNFDVNVKFNIQAKQHEGNEGINSLFQISKSDDSDPYVKNVVVTTANLDENLRREAKEREIILFGPQELAEMIIDNFENIDREYQAKLNLFSLIKPALK